MDTLSEDKIYKCINRVHMFQVSVRGYDLINDAYHKRIILITILFPNCMEVCKIIKLFKNNKRVMNNYLLRIFNQFNPYIPIYQI